MKMASFALLETATNRQTGQTRCHKEVGAIKSPANCQQMAKPAGVGLSHHQWKMVVELSLHHFARRPRYGLGALLSRKPSRWLTSVAACLISPNARTIGLGMRSSLMRSGTFGLRAPQSIGWHLDETERVSLSVRVLVTPDDPRTYGHHAVV